MHHDSMPAAQNRAQALAQSVDCFTEQDVCVLYGITPATAEAWRKRRKGPSYILAGNNYLYPRSSVAADLQTRVRERGITQGAVLL